MFCRRTWCGAVSSWVWTHVLTWAASHLTSRVMQHPSLKVKRSSSPQSRSSQRPPSLAPSSSHKVSGAPSRKHQVGFQSFCLNNSCSEVKDKKGVCLMSMHTYVHTAHVCTQVCVCTVCECVFLYIRVKWPGQSCGCQADSVRGEQHLLSRPPPSPLLSSSGATVWAATRPLHSGSIWTAACLWQNPSSRTVSGLICWWSQSPIPPRNTQMGMSGFCFVRLCKLTDPEHGLLTDLES